MTIADLILAPVSAKDSVFESYRLDSWPHGVVRMAQLTANTARDIADEPGVLLRRTSKGWEVFSRGNYVPVVETDYVVRFGVAPWCTAVVTAAEKVERYSELG